MVDKREMLKVKLCGVELDNPVIPASGTFGYGREFAELYDINILGSFSFKGTTEQPRFGNPTPRIAECREGLINSVGLQNPGVEKVIEEELPAIEKIFKKPVMANVSGFSTEEYVRVSERLAAQEQVGWIELNISCPNVHEGGMAFGTDPKQAAGVVGAVRKALDAQKPYGGSRPLIVKLSPNVRDIGEIAFACEAAGAEGLTLINTLQGMRIDLKKKRPVIAEKIGGFSGTSILPGALRMMYQAYERVKIPLVGCGGVREAEDVLEMMLAGATAVQVGAANLVNPFVCREIIEALPETAGKYGIKKLSEITGGAH